jgi:hypothetical protein
VTNNDNSMRKKVTIDIWAANRWGLFLLAVSAVLLLVPYFLMSSWSYFLEQLTNGWAILVFCFSLVAGVFLHEGIHGLTWGLTNRNFHNVSFGIIRKYITPYCHYSEPMSRSKYILGAVMPFLLLGIVPAVWGLMVMNVWIIFFAIFFIAGAAGDLWMIGLILKENPKAQFLDHPSEAGFFVIENE